MKFMARIKKKTINYKFSDKHRMYIKACKNSTYNVAEGAVRAGKTVDNVLAFAFEIMNSKQRIHLATGSTVGNAKLNIGDCNGMGLEYIFRGQCRWTRYKDNEALIIKGPSTKGKDKVIIFAGGAKADSYKRIRGNTYEKVISTEINLHHMDTVKEMIARTLISKDRKFFWDLNPDHPNHWIYKNYIDKYLKMQNDGTFPSGINYQHFTIKDNATLTFDRIMEIEAEYEKGSIWYKRDILGQRAVAEGLIFKFFADNQDSFIADYNKFDIRKITIGIDFGGNKSNHAFIATGITRNFKEIIVLESTLKKPGTPEDLNNDFITFAKMIINKYGFISETRADSAEPVLIRGLQNAVLKAGINLKIENAIKSNVKIRTKATEMLMAQRRFYLTKNAMTLKNALAFASWDEKKQEDVRKDDFTSDMDSIDAYEYSFERWINKLLPVLKTDNGDKLIKLLR